MTGSIVAATEAPYFTGSCVAVACEENEYVSSNVCTPCDAGYGNPAGDDATGDDTSCANIDECATNADNCDANATCTDSEGSFSCACNDGYSGDGQTCTDIDECAGITCSNGGACSEADGETTLGNYTCTCAAGYEGGGLNSTVCTDIDECAGITCSNGGACSEADGETTLGNYTCTCAAGYEGGGLNSTVCTDIDECATEADNCDANATCTDSEGSFNCACQSGWSGDGTSCSICTPGTYSAAGSTDSCSPSNCAAGDAATKSGAVSETDCTTCAAGTYSSGGASSACSASNCAGGDAATKTGAVSETDCTTCLAGTYSSGGASSACSASNCLINMEPTKVGATSATDCEACATDFFSDGGLDTCETCASIDFCEEQHCLSSAEGVCDNCSQGYSPSGAACVPGMLEDFEGVQNDWTFLNQGLVENNDDTDSFGLHLLITDSACLPSIGKFLDDTGFDIPATAKAIRFDVGGQVPEVGASIYFEIGVSGAPFRGTLSTPVSGWGPGPVSYCIPSALSGTSSNVLRFELVAEGSCSSSPDFHLWVDNIVFSEDDTGCVPMLSP
jgi:hypothetical protein